MLQEKAMLISFSVSIWTAQKQDREVSQKAAADYGAAANSGRYVKWLFDKKVVDEVAKVGRKARMDIFYKYTLPWSNDGLRILPANLFLKFTQEIEKAKKEFWERVDKFIEIYKDSMDMQKVRLGSMFKPEDYPDEFTLRKKFAFEYNVYPLPDKEDFRISLAEDEMKRIKEDLERTLMKTAREGVASLWQRLYEKVNKIVVSLEDKGGKRKKIFNSLLGNVEELMVLLPELNIFNDPQLDNIRKEIENKILTYTTEELKENELARKTTRENAKAVLNTMSQYY